MSAASKAYQQLVKHISSLLSMSAASQACQQSLWRWSCCGKSLALLAYAGVCWRMLTYADEPLWWSCCGKSPCVSCKKTSLWETCYSSWHAVLAVDMLRHVRLAASLFALRYFISNFPTFNKWKWTDGTNSQFCTESWVICFTDHKNSKFIPKKQKAFVFDVFSLFFAAIVTFPAGGAPHSKKKKLIWKQ